VPGAQSTLLVLGPRLKVSLNSCLASGNGSVELLEESGAGGVEGSGAGGVEGSGAGELRVGELEVEESDGAESVLEGSGVLPGSGLGVSS